MLCLTALTFVLTLTSVTDVPNPRPQDSWVSDMADVLPADAEARIDSLLDALHADTDVEFAVVTVNEIDGMAKPFATALFNHWGIGDAQTNRGGLLLLVMGQRRLEVEVGYGLEDDLPDGWLGTMQSRAMVPRFKSGDFAGGVEVGLLEIDARLRGEVFYAHDLPSALVGTTPSAPAPRSQSSRSYEEAQSDDSWFWLLMIGLLSILPLWLLWRWTRIRRHRRCRECKINRDKLSEQADDEHLVDGQITEERIRSVDYHVYVCRKCSSSSTLANRAWFSGYSSCRQCHFRTMSTSSTTISAATYHSSGTGRKTENCSHCDHHSTYTFTIPMRVKSTSSSSSSGSSFGGGGGGGGSSFGGGSSGGGGAGSSW